VQALDELAAKAMSWVARGTDTRTPPGAGTA
jgi:hypothetical protein